MVRPVPCGRRSGAPLLSGVAALRRCGTDHGAVRAVLVQGFPNALGQHRKRTGFEECATSVLVRPTDSLLEKYGLAQVGEPVVAVQDRRVQPGAGDPGYER